MGRIQDILKEVQVMKDTPQVPDIILKPVILEPIIVNNKIRVSASRKVFNVFNIILLTIISLSCILPFIHLLAISLSSSVPVMAGRVGLWPVEFTTGAYRFVLGNPAFFRSLWVSIQRIGVGVPINLIFIVLTAYPISRSLREFRARSVMAWFFVFTMLFNGGLIPGFMIVRATGLMNTIWALTIPGALPIFSMLIVMNYMRMLPQEIFEAAYIDGASHIKTLVKVVLPISAPTLATVGLFSFVGHWNDWLGGRIFMDRVEMYPLQTYLQTVIIDPLIFFQNLQNVTTADVSIFLDIVNARTNAAAQLFLGLIPILLVYPFCQKYFTTGLVLGSVKG